MAITNLIIKLKPEEIPEYLRGQFFELHKDVKFESGGTKLLYVGWLHIREDGTIEFGEPGA